jgi:hypothetical protein
MVVDNLGKIASRDLHRPISSRPAQSAGRLSPTGCLKLEVEVAFEILTYCLRCFSVLKGSDLARHCYMRSYTYYSLQPIQPHGHIFTLCGSEIVCARSFKSVSMVKHSGYHSN